MNKTTISIPKPCHENWNEMAPAEKGKFCAACAKNVYDFTKSSDREILQRANNDEGLCGRFLQSQLNRDLVVPKEKPSIWIAAATGILGFLSLGSSEAFAQAKPETVQTEDNFALGKFAPAPKNERMISGIAADSSSVLPGAIIQIKGTTRIAMTDASGRFSIEAKTGEILVCSYIAMKDSEIEIKPDISFYKFDLKYDEAINVTVGIVVTAVRKRTFFGRMFRSVGSIFR